MFFKCISRKQKPVVPDGRSAFCTCLIRENRFSYDCDGVVSVVATRFLFALLLMMQILFQASGSDASATRPEYLGFELDRGIQSHSVGRSYDRALLTQLDESTDPDLVAHIQQLLAAHGFDPGPADGIAGPQTRQAISDFQRSIGLAADGRPSRGLFEKLVARTDRDSTSTAEAGASPDAETTGSRRRSIGGPAGTDAAAYEPDRSPENDRRDEADRPIAPEHDLADSVWRFVDSRGSEFTLSLLPHSAVRGVLYEEFWSWRQTGDKVEITYDNGMGLKVTRSGTLTGATSMAGQAYSSRGDQWTWMATKIATPVATEGAGD